MIAALLACVAGGGVTESKPPAESDACEASVELCNGLDDDCDGEVDEGSADATTWYLDGDADGDGSPSTTTVSCDAPEGYVASSGDCDDSAPLVASTLEEICGDGVDNDCADGDLACQVVWSDPPDWADAKVVPPAGNESFGGSVSSIPGAAPEMPAKFVNSTSFEGQAGDRWFGIVGIVATHGTYQVQEADVLATDSNDDTSLGHLFQVGDLGGDGVPDLVVSAYSTSNPDLGFFVLEGPVSGAQTTTADVPQLWTDSARDAASAVAIGDNDADGRPEFALGFSGNSYTDESSWVENRGTVYILEGPFVGNVDLDDAGGVRFAPNPAGVDKKFGYRLCSSDLDGDGLGDLGISSPAHGSALAGSVSVVLAPFDSDRTVTNGYVADDGAQGDWAGDGHDAWTGYSLTCATDASGDGLPDLFITAHNWADGTGEAYLVAGPATGLHSVREAAWTIAGESEGDLLGRQATADSDLDGDGFGDVAVGTDAPNDHGTTLVFYGGNLAGVATPVDADHAWTGDNENDLACIIAGGADLNDDGFDDFAIGAWGDSTVGLYAGAIYLVYGGPRP